MMIMDIIYLLLSSVSKFSFENMRFFPKTFKFKS